MQGCLGVWQLVKHFSGRTAKAFAVREKRIARVEFGFAYECAKIQSAGLHLVDDDCVFLHRRNCIACD
jgi:hypothetical protein